MERSQPGDTVRFTSSRDEVIERGEEIREGFEGNHLVIVRQGLAIIGCRHIVLSSYATMGLIQ